MRCPDRHGRRSAASARRGPPSARIKPSPPRCRGPSGPTIAIWCLIRPLFNPHAPPAAVGSAGKDRTSATRERPQTSPTARAAATTCSTFGGAMTWRPGLGRRYSSRSPAARGPSATNAVQGYTLMSHMVELGWICVSINYSKSPRSAFPAHLVDVKRAIAWVRENIADYGGDPDFLAITGGSAGGHLASLAALTPNDPTFQPGFEDADTTVQAAAPYYGVYDFTDVDEHARTDAAVPRAVRDEGPLHRRSPSASRRLRRFPTRTGMLRRSLCCTARKTKWFPAARRGPSPRRCGTPEPLRCPTPNSPMRTTLSTSPRRSGHVWQRKRSRTSLESSTAGAPSRYWTPRRSRPVRLAEDSLNRRQRRTRLLATRFHHRTSV